MARRMGVIAYTSEWAGMMLYEAIFNRGFGDKFVITAIAGREANADEAKIRLLENIEARSKMLASKVRASSGWRIGKNLAYVRNAARLVEMIDSGKLAYSQIDLAAVTLPPAFYEVVDVVGIYTSNPHHLKPLQDAIRHRKHVLVEKPTVPVIDKNGNATKVDLDALAGLEQERQIIKHTDEIWIVAQDAEHYSAKPEAKTLFDNFLDMLQRCGPLQSIEGEIIEEDHPDNPRTMDLLNRQNRTGLLTDTGVHLFSLLTNLGLDIGQIRAAKYAKYSDPKVSYDVETYAKVDFDVGFRLFDSTLPCTFTVAKFADCFKEPRTESKRLILHFRDDDVVVDFKMHDVYSIKKGYVWSTTRSSFEYENILTDFDNAISKQKGPRTSLGNAIINLGAIYMTLSQFPVDKGIDSVYK